MSREQSESALALLLAGGEGRRLRPLTDHRPKPLVSFGYTRRIIDFALDNLDSAGVPSVHLLGPDSLLDSLEEWKGRWAERGGVLSTLAPPSGRYAGTGDAVRSARGLIRSLAPDVVMVLPSDHVYHTVLSDVLREHRAGGNRITLVLARVPAVDAAQLGVVSRDESGRLVSCVEKPAPADLPEAGDCLVSTGIFLFETSALLEFLDSRPNPASADWDLAPNLFPPGDVAVLEVGCYWRDVGTIGAWWRAHMDFLESTSTIDETPSSSRTRGIHRTVCAADVIVEAGALVDQCVLLSGVRVEAGARLRRVIIDGPNIVPAGFELDGSIASPNERWPRDPFGVIVIPAASFPPA